MDAVHIENDAIFNMFIDQLSIDKVLLSPDEDDVERNFVFENARGRREFRDNIQQAILMDGVIIRYREGNRGRDANRDPYRKVLVEDMAVIIASLEERKAAEIINLRAARQDRDRCEHELSKLNQEIKQLELDMQSGREKCRQEQRLKEVLENELEQIQEAGKIDTTVLEAEERELKEAIESFSREIVVTQTELDSAESDKKSRQAEKQRAQKVVDDLGSSLEKLRDKVDKFMNRRTEIQTNIDRCKSKLAQAERAVADVEGILESKKASVQEKRINAQQRTENHLRNQNPAWDGNDITLGERETDDYLRKKIDMLERKLEDGKKTVGLGRVTRDQAIANLKNAEDDYMKLKDEIETLGTNVQHLKSDVKARRKKWYLQRDKASEKVDKWFDRYLQKKAHRYAFLSFQAYSLLI